MRKIHKELQGLLNVYKSYWEGEGGEGGSILISYLRQLKWIRLVDCCLEMMISLDG